MRIRSESVFFPIGILLVSCINFGLQSVATARTLMDPTCEGWVKWCNSMDAVRKAIAERPEMKEAWKVSM